MADRPTALPAFLTVDLEDQHEHQAFPNGILLDECVWSLGDRTRVLLELLGECRARGTFFTTGPVMERYPGLLREIASLGHELALHGPRHVMAYDLAREEFRASIVEGKARLEDVTGEAVLGYRAPSWSIRRENGAFLDDIVGSGFRYDSSIFPMENPAYGVRGAPRIPYRLANGLVEIPPSAAAFGPFVIPFGGGFYLRALPTLVLRRLARSALRRDGLVLYVHPWELARDPERLPYPPIDRIVRRWGVDSTVAKLRVLLGLAPHLPIRESSWLSDPPSLPLLDPFHVGHDRAAGVTSPARR